jgi:DNA-binding transcriptional LysR family regulator
LEFEVGLNPFLLDAIRNGGLDLAIIAGRVIETGLETLDLGCVRFSWMASPKMFPGQDIIEPADLRRSPILYQGTNSYTNGMMDRLLGISGNRERKGTTCNSLEAIYSLARAGVGVGFLPLNHSADFIAKGELKLLQTDPAEFEMPFSVVSLNNSSPLFADIAQLCVQSSEFDKSGCGSLPG